jgi:hypothetical protein
MVVFNKEHLGGKTHRVKPRGNLFHPALLIKIIAPFRTN